MQTPLKSNGWQIENAEYVFFKDGLKPLIGRDRFEALGISVTQTLCSYEDEETVTLNELLPVDHWGSYRSGRETERNMCKATQELLSRERLADDNESRFLHSTKIHRLIPLRDATVQLNIAQKNTRTSTPKRVSMIYTRC